MFTKITRHRVSTSTRWHFTFDAMFSLQRSPRTDYSPPNSAQLEGITYYSPTYNRVRAAVWKCGKGQTGRHTDTHRRPWPIYISPRLRLPRNVTRQPMGDSKLRPGHKVVWESYSSAARPPTGAGTWRTRRNITSSGAPTRRKQTGTVTLIITLRIWPNYGQWRHPQNRKYITYCIFVRTEPRSPCTENFMKCGNVILEMCKRTDGHRPTDGQTDIRIRSSQYFAPYRVNCHA